MSSSTKKKETVGETLEGEAIMNDGTQNTPAPAVQEKPQGETLMVSKDMLSAMISQAVAAALGEQKRQSDERISELERELSEAKKAKPASVSDDVTLVYLSTSPGIINKVPGLQLRCTHYGEEFTLPRYQFDQVVGEYRKWFDEGILAVSRDNVDVAAKKGLKTQDEYHLSSDILSKVGTMKVDDLKKLWASLRTENERLSLIFYYKRKFIEGTEPGFREADRVLAMNVLTNQGFSRESLEIAGAQGKFQPRDFMSC